MTTVITLGIILVIITSIVVLTEYRKRVKMKPFASILQERNMRLQLLEKSMDALFKNHKVIDKIGDAYDLIATYVACRDQTETEYCRDYLRKLYSSGYTRYDDERTK